MGHLPQLASVHKGGFFDFRHVDGATYDKTIAQFKKDAKPINLPSWKRLKKFGKRSDLRILLNDLVVTIYFKTGTKYQYIFQRGYITDLASVPGFFRGVVDNDDIDVILAALVHDRNFSVHSLTFKQTNELFYKMFLARKGIPGSDEKWVSLPRRARIAWFSVNSVVGRFLWKRMAKRRMAWTLATSTLRKVRHGKSDPQGITKNIGRPKSPFALCDK
jgi:hypothetical protein